MLFRSILSIGPEDGEAAVILKDSEAGQTAGYENEEKIRRILTEYFIRYGEQCLESNTGNRIKYSRKELTGEISKILDTL